MSDQFSDHPATNRSGPDGPVLALFQWCQSRPRTFVVILSLLFLLPGFFSLPPLDRDESRFAQATKQMLESGDYVEIRFQEDARNKKPVGIYWMQALPAALVGGADHDRIWAYRIPSFLAGLAALLLVFEAGRFLFDPRAGLIASLLLGSSLLLVVESSIAKTDAALMAVTLFAMGVLARHYVSAGDDSKAPPGPALTWGLWGALGIGILIKGPVILLVCGSAVLALALFDRSATWLKDLRPVRGLLLMLLVTLPWFVAIALATDGAFFAEALGKDFGGKVVSGQESHGAPPGLYLALLWLTFWPATLLLLPAGVWAWRERERPAVRFLLAWAVPTWLVMELIPTKLPHYTLPLYPALALLTAGFLVETLASAKGREVAGSISGRTGLALWVLPSLLLAGLLIVLPMQYDGGVGVASISAMVLTAVLALCAATFFWRGELLRAVAAASITGLFLIWTLIDGTLTRLDAFQLSPQLKTATRAAGYDDAALVGIFGYSEPSFIFLNGTRTHLVSKRDAVSFLATTPDRALWVEAEKDALFQEGLAARGLSAVALATVDGFNYSKGDPVTLTLYRLNAVAPVGEDASEGPGS